MRAGFERKVLLPVSSFGAVALLLLGLVVTFEVILRALGIAIVGAVEVSEVLLALLVFAALAFTQSENGHVAMEALVAQATPGYRRVARVISLTVCAVTAAIMTWGAALQAIRSFQAKEFQFGTVQFPLWPTKAVVAVGLGLMALELLFQVASGLRARGRPTEDGDEAG